MKKLMIGLLFAMPTLAFAHGGKIDATLAATNAALAKFKAEEGAHADHFAGVKAWPSADKLMVKVYLADKTEANYSCTMTDIDGQHTVACTKK